jgi:methylated-DNA-[protein]-cysteine S-methyltransferase
MKKIEPVLHSITPTAIGEIGVAYNINPFLLVSIFLPRPDGTNSIQQLTKAGWAHEGLHPKALEISNLIQGYFRGEPIRLCWDDMCTKGLTGLQQAVLKATADIPFGRLKSYREIAVAIGRPRAYRFVGSTLAKNPFPILVPCHRVILSNGSIGQFGGGVALKKKLIEFEAGYGTGV